MSYVLFSKEVLLSMSNGVVLDSFFAQVGFESGHGMFLLRDDDYEIRYDLYEL